MAIFIKQVNIPQKGDIVNIDMQGYGTTQQYRILKNISGSIYEVLGMSNLTTSTFGTSQTYANGTLDTYLNSTWYNTLSSTAKEAIVDKTFRQDSWYKNNSGNPVYVGALTRSSYNISLSSASFGAEITRHVYALSVQDVLDYLEVTPQMTASDTTLTDVNVWQMFWNSSTQQENAFVRLCSAQAGGTLYVLTVSGTYGNFGTNGYGDQMHVRPAFQIDLSKIDYTFADGRSLVELKPVSILQKSNNALSRVGMSYKIPVDLTGTTWLFNNSLTISSEQNYYISFKNEYTNTIYDLLALRTAPLSMLYVQLGITSDAVYQNGSWTAGDTYKTITILGGTDVTNQDLVTWLQANATQQ